MVARHHLTTTSARIDHIAQPLLEKCVAAEADTAILAGCSTQHRTDAATFPVGHQHVSYGA